ncbi:putative bifunctional diguanylate cyclase/phosphodiesterase [Oscillatoria salina]|uniref:putative bifunctional diguanylate cyclase/phosphodiesterase n=1 Tax=Oscillatoria salina TaxID=331517 RepID=UPI0013B95321|nr:EAL domain-containing protein [Oscillatoria salina]MBZ8181763.1 EAL domain-containing protein [Oscillatoria salina IIICB1]NET91471.1 EAL domain-containing protein [Kamptonema sp. SIO1D9]
MSKLLRVLIVEDFVDDAELLLLELRRNGYEPISQRVETKIAMKTALEQQDWEVILCDYSLPQFCAMEALRLLQEKELDIPFLIVSGSIGEETAVAAMKAGAHDYLLKDKLARLVPAIEREIREAKERGARRKAEKKLRYFAYYNELTGLPNRTKFIKHLNLKIKNFQEHNFNSPFAVLLLDLDRYQMIKYSLGHLVGEEMLRSTSRRLKTCLSDRDFLAHLGGDNFAFLLPDIDTLEQAKQRINEIQSKLKSPHNFDGPVITSTASIGVVMSNLSYQQAEDFLKAADTAMHYAKLQGRGSWAVFDRSMHEKVIERFNLETDLQQALKSAQLYLHYQPIVSLQTEELIGFEALVRWRHPQQGVISPAKFIPVAEESGLIISLGEWVLTEAIERLCIWQEYYPHNSDLTISVNVSGLQLKHPNFLANIDRICEQFRLSGHKLKLEITESVLMENPQAVSRLLTQLQEREIRICIDDFGTGYSSLAYLHHLPINILKIDRSFINNMDNGGKNIDIVRAIISLADSLGLEAIAEGVETQQQRDLLRDLGCEYAQGYFFSRPLPDDAVLALLSTNPV